MTESGRVSWTSPTGGLYPADAGDVRLPLYPGWLQRLIIDTVAQDHLDPSSDSSEPEPAPTDEPTLVEANREEPEISDYELPDDPGETLEIPEPYILVALEEVQLDAAAIKHALAFPDLGLADSA